MPHQSASSAAPENSRARQAPTNPHHPPRPSKHASGGRQDHSHVADGRGDVHGDERPYSALARGGSRRVAAQGEPLPRGRVRGCSSAVASAAAGRDEEGQGWREARGGGLGAGKLPRHPTPPNPISPHHVPPYPTPPHPLAARPRPTPAAPPQMIRMVTMALGGEAWLNFMVGTFFLSCKIQRGLSGGWVSCGCVAAPFHVGDGHEVWDCLLKVDWVNVRLSGPEA